MGFWIIGVIASLFMLGIFFIKNFIEKEAFYAFEFYSTILLMSALLFIIIRDMQVSKKALKQYALELELTQKKLEDKNYSMKISLDIIDKYVILSSTTLDGTITKVSEAFCEITGYTQEELLGNTHNVIRNKDIHTDIYKELWTTIESGKTWVGEIKNKKKDGSFYWLLSTISPTYDKDGKKIAYTAICQNISSQKSIEELSVTDELTGIYNRRHFNTLFPKMIQSAQRDGSLFCFMVLDIDHFKLYNDNYGHQRGDMVLNKFALALQNSLKRVDDFSFRLGGEEFGIIYKAQTKEKALHFAQNVLENIIALKLKHEHSLVVPYVTASAGLYCKHADEISSAAEVYKDTDVLLYRAKNEGRNRVVANI